MCTELDWARLKNSLPGPTTTPLAFPVICTPSELPPEKTLLEIVDAARPGGFEPSVVTVTRPSRHDPHGLMLLNTSWSTTMFALATVETMFSVSVKVLLAIVMSCAPRRVPPGIVMPLTVMLLGERAQAHARPRRPARGRA